MLQYHSLGNIALGLGTCGFSLSPVFWIGFSSWLVNPEFKSTFNVNGDLEADPEGEGFYP